MKATSRADGGNISGEEMVRRFWECSLRGGYAGHGETYDVPEANGKLWWSHGGPLRGGEPCPYPFSLHQILCETPGAGLKFQPLSWDDTCGVPEETRGPARYMLDYYGFGRPNKRTFNLPAGIKYKVEVIDTWDMTTPTPVYTKASSPSRCPPSSGWQFG